MLRIALLLLVSIAAFPAAAQETGSLPFHLPTPEGWKTETIPFPLGFAPDLDYAGLEELRFAPGMFDSTAVDFWTYTFVWWVEPDADFSVSRLEGDLVAYWDGLAAAVGPGRGFEMGEHESTVRLRTEPDPESVGPMQISGTAHIFEPFVTGRPLDLYLEIRIDRCEQQDRRVISIAVSPQPASHAVWSTMGDIWRGFSCEAGSRGDH
ncbi:hypothetical protein KDM41_04045 [bacterium]|nr:hypothetical protein [bacterium]